MADPIPSSLAYPTLCGLLALRPTKLSQAMHNAGFQSLSLPFSYVAFDVADTAAGLRAARTLGIRGLSLTIPHKENALSLVDDMSQEAREIGAINTVLNDGTQWHGDNTDWYGISRALEEGGVDVAGRKVLMLGAGGAARAGVYALKRLGASKICIFNRNQERAEALAKEFSVEAQDLSSGCSIGAMGFGLVVNATPVGSVLASEHVHPFSLDNWPSELAVFDMVTRATALTQTAQLAGATVVEGPRMLLYQAVKQFELFCGQPAPVEAMAEALRAQLEASG